MPTYTVVWMIDEDDAETPLQAAQLAHQRCFLPGTHATVFDVVDQATGEVTRVDVDPAEAFPPTVLSDDYAHAMGAVLACEA